MRSDEVLDLFRLDEVAQDAQCVDSVGHDSCDWVTVLVLLDSSFLDLLMFYSLYTRNTTDHNSHLFFYTPSYSISFLNYFKFSEES